MGKVAPKVVHTLVFLVVGDELEKKQESNNSFVEFE